MKNILKNSALISVANLSSAGIGFLLIPIMISQLGLAPYGEIVMILGGVYSLGVLVDLQVWQPLTAKLVKCDSNKADLILSSLFLEYRNLIVGVLFALLIFFAGVHLKLFPLRFLDYIYPALIILFVLPSGTLLSYFRSTERYSLLSAYVLFPSILRLVLFLIIDVYTVADAFWVYAVAELGRLPFLVFLLIKFRRGSLIGEKVSFKSLFWPWLASSSNLPATQLDRLIVGGLLGAESVAIYHVIKRIAQVFSQLAGPLNQVLYPEMLKMLHESEGKGRVLLLAKKIFLAVFMLGLILFVLSISTQQWWLSKFIPQSSGAQWLLFVFLAIQLIEISFIFIHPLSLALLGFKIPAIITLGSNFLFVILLFLFAKYGVGASLLVNAIQMYIVVFLKLYLCFEKIK